MGIVVIDYGMGNLRSVTKALEHLGAKVKITSSAGDLAKAEKLILPGVGAFGDASEELQKRGLFQPIQNEIGKGKPFLGICLGLQLLFEESEESPKAKGLGVIKGKVKRFHSKDIKIPHMGWNSTKIQSKHSFFADFPKESFFYFVHSYYAKPEDSKVIAGACTYGKEEFTAIVADKNLIATQFHPEKSQEDGLHILKNFIRWKP